MSEQDKTKSADSGELQNDQLDAVAGGIVAGPGGCVWPPTKWPIDKLPGVPIDPITDPILLPPETE
jgi:hypothetical protein